MTDRLGDKISAAELLNEMTAIVQEEIGFNQLFADQIAAAIIAGLRRRRGGQEVYIPAPDKSPRDDRIRSEFNGRNRAEIMSRYNISKSRLYEIVGK